MLISLSARPLENSLGRPVARTRKGVTNFWKWFGRSKIRDSQGRPLVVYHGTSSDIPQVDPSRFGKGLDEFGPGFYTTTSYLAAGNYTSQDGGNIIPLYIKIEHPLNRKRKLTPNSIQLLIKKSPDYKESIMNFGDISYLGEAKVVQTAVHSYLDYQGDCLQTLNTICNDFWTGHEGDFLHRVRVLTGSDGVIYDFAQGKHFVTWFPNQVKSIFNETFDPESHTITASSIR